MKFRTRVEPPEPMRGLEVPPEVVEALGGGKRPAVIITINGHSWTSRVAIMRGRNLLGLLAGERELELRQLEPGRVGEPGDRPEAAGAEPHKEDRHPAIWPIAHAPPGDCHSPVDRFAPLDLGEEAQNP